MIPLPPCKDCPFRQVNCHSSCERWAAYQIEKDEAQAKIRKERDKYRFILNAEIERKAKEKDRKRKRKR